MSKSPKIRKDKIMEKKEQEIVIKYSVDKSGAMTTDVTYDMDSTVLDALVALQLSYNNLSKQATKAVTEDCISEKEVEDCFRATTINDLANR